MDEEIEQKLLALNQSFYDQFALSFADSRNNPQPGFKRLLDFIPEPCHEVLDVGCGNARFGRFLQSNIPEFKYFGIDFSEELLKIADGELPGAYFQRDISQQGFLNGFGKFDLIVCLSVLQHLPSRANRVKFLNELSSHLSDTGRIFLGNWQFIDSQRQRRKILEWHTIGMSNLDIERGDFLLSWQRDGFGYRYVCLINESETKRLAGEANLQVVKLFRDDGREGNLNLYSILAHI